MIIVIKFQSIETSISNSAFMSNVLWKLIVEVYEA
jgi:hypothetical protein